MIYVEILLLLLVFLLCAFIWFWISFKRDDEREKLRREREGYWVEYLGPCQLRAFDDDIALVYHEGEKWQFFYGKTYSKPRRQAVFVPDEEQWQAEMPDWLKDRRALVVERIQQRVKYIQIRDHASFDATLRLTREQQMAKYQAEGYHVVPLPNGDFAATPLDGTPSLFRKQEDG